MSTTETTSSGQGPRKKDSGFFALDIRQFERLPREGLGLEEAATYLSLLVSTDQSNVTSSGGVNSVMDYTGLTRAEVKKAIARLEERRLLKALEVERKRARTVPRYTLPQHDPRLRLGGIEQTVVDAVAAGRQPAGKAEVNAAQRAQTKGYLEKRSDGWHILEHVAEVAFIPNHFVRAAEGESPIRRLVTHGELGPIMLAVEFYRQQDLMDERGVPTSTIRLYLTAEDERRIGQYRLHRMSTGRHIKDANTGEARFWEHAAWGDKIRGFDKERFWRDLTALEGAHVIEWALYSTNGKPAGGGHAINRPQRPLGALRNGGQVLGAPESIAAFAAYLLWLCAEDEMPAAMSLTGLIEDWRRTSPIIALENQSVDHVEGVGTLRMTHRAATDNSRAWLRQAAEESKRALFLAEQVARDNFPQALGIIQGLQSKESLSGAISM